MFLPFDLFLVASRIDLRDLEISRGRKREWAKQFGEGGGDSSVASFRLTISVGRLHSDLFRPNENARLDELPGEFQIVATFATWIGSLTKIRLAGAPSPFLSRAFLPSLSLPRETTPVFDIPGKNIINFWRRAISVWSGFIVDPTTRIRALWRKRIRVEKIEIILKVV